MQVSQLKKIVAALEAKGETDIVVGIFPRRMLDPANQLHDSTWRTAVEDMDSILKRLGDDEFRPHVQGLIDEQES